MAGGAETKRQLRVRDGQVDVNLMKRPWSDFTKPVQQGYSGACRDVSYIYIYMCIYVRMKGYVGIDGDLRASIVEEFALRSLNIFLVV